MNWTGEPTRTEMQNFAQTEARESQVNMALRQCMEQGEELLRVVSSLEDRLVPCLGPPNPQSNKEETQVDSNIPLVKSLTDIKEIMGRAREILIDLMGRVEL